MVLDEKTAPLSKKKSKLWLIPLILALLISSGALYWYLFLYGSVSTDNAYVVADSATISSRIPGTVLVIYAENDKHVEKGAPLLELDPSDYELQKAQAEATLERLRAEIRAMEIEIELTERTSKSNYKAAKAAMEGSREQKKRLQEMINELKEKRRAVQAELELTTKDHLRISNLYEQGVVPKRSKDMVDKTHSQAKANFASVESEIQAALKGISAAQREIERQEAILEKALAEMESVELKREKLAALKAQEKEVKARYELAILNLSYCKIEAPISGQVAQKRIQVGDRVSPGQPLMAIVPLDKVYVEANFKETQIEEIRKGQEAIIRPDMYPGIRLKGRVVGIRAGTGAAFSLLPPENATGNWIKVVQRVPVRIELEEKDLQERPLRIGTSLHVTVFTKKVTTSERH